jgi:hypothetical protein
MVSTPAFANTMLYAWPVNHSHYNLVIVFDPIVDISVTLFQVTGISDINNNIKSAAMPGDEFCVDVADLLLS